MKNEIARGSTIFSVECSVSMTTLIFSIKKLAFLKQPNKTRLTLMPNKKKSFEDSALLIVFKECIFLARLKLTRIERRIKGK